jgi:hypothetical protein
MEPDVDSGPIWDSQNTCWVRNLVPLPMTSYGKLVLIPKIIVRHQLWYRFDEYYRHYLLPEMQQEELKANSSLVQVLKNHTRRVTKKSLMEHYGSDKLAVVRETIKRPHILNNYKNEKDSESQLPLTHDEFAEIQKTQLPDWGKLIDQLNNLKIGKKDATKYEDLIEKLLTSIFYPSLCNPTKQHKIHDGRKRIDITYTNEANKGVFSWLSKHYSCPFIFIECKNYGKEVGNPEIDQLAGRFSPSRGKIGLLIYRQINDKKLLLKRCIDTAKDNRGFIIPLDDNDIKEIVTHQLSNLYSQEYPLLKERFTELIS